MIKFASMELIFQYPIWFIGFCLLLGAVYAFVLYFKTKDFSDDTKEQTWVKRLMAAFRFLSVSLLSFLLLSPLLKSRTIDKIQPKIVSVHDNSSSVSLSFAKIDSATYINDLNEMHKAFETKYGVDFYNFSDDIYKTDSLNFLGKRTNISRSLESLNGNYFNQNVGAVILATDGIYNEGINPIYSNFNFPIYAIALGDTSIQKDLKLSAVSANKIVYLNDKFEVNVNIESYNLSGKSYQLSVYKKDKLEYSKALKIGQEYSEITEKFVLDAVSVGMQKYTVKLSELEGEITYENNFSDFYVDVIDSRQKVLLLANAPHPDIAALKQSIEGNKNLDLEIQYIKNYNAKLEKYNLIILHQLPSQKQNAAQVFNAISKEKIPFFMISGSQTDYNLWNTNQSMISVKINAGNENDVSPYFDINFNAFTLDENTLASLKTFPPLSIPFGNFKAAANTKSLLKQKIGAVETDYPLLCFQESFGVKSAVFIGEGLWRWRLHDFLENGNHEAFDELFSKTINYLALKSDKRKFRVHTPKNIFFETEEVQIEAELYNESYELVNQPEVSLNLKNEKGEDFPLGFSRTNNAYVLKTKNLPVGEYTYEAKTVYDNKNYKADGVFNIKALQLEALQTRANHKMLYQLAEKTGGKVFYPNELEELKTLILNKEDIKPTLFESFKTRSIINLKAIFFLILSLLSIEWFMRKYNGAY